MTMKDNDTLASSLNKYTLFTVHIHNKNEQRKLDIREYTLNNSIYVNSKTIKLV